MNFDHLPSFLSNHVKNLLVKIGESKLNILTTDEYINKNLTIKWAKIESILCVPENFSIHNQPSTWFTDKIGELWPVFVEAHSVLFRSDPNVNVDLYQWTSHPEELEEYLKLFLNFNVSTTEAIQFLTAVLERSLGNIFLLKGSSVPSLLRDLLATVEMHSILGQVPVTFLQILMGTPLALNLRNIVWHGFPREDELFPHFVSALFVTVFSVGELLPQRKINIHTIPKRALMCFSEETFHDSFPIVQRYPVEILKLLSHSPFIPSSHFPYWKYALDLTNNGSHGRSLLLLLPQVEHMLRCLFCNVNSCSERTLTAESVALYTTLNEIMSENVVSEEREIRENKLINFLGENVMEMLQDLFVHQAGPRVRDKMSHGECNIQGVSQWIVNQLVLVVLVIQMKSEEHLPSECVKDDDKIVELKKIVLTYQSYETRFHQSSLLKTSIAACFSKLNVWSSYAELSNRVERGDADYARTELYSLIRKIHNCLLENGSFVWDETPSVFVASLRIHTIFRHKLESELVNILRQIMSQIEQICEQIIKNLEEKLSLSSQHLLRSRQRDTFQRMLCLIPKLKDVLYYVTCIVLICLQSVNCVSSLSSKEFQKLIKFCRNILQFVQNVTSLTRCDKNRWVEIEMLCEKICYDILKNVNFICLSKCT